MRRLVVFDIDGTIVSYATNPSHIPEPTLEALRLLNNAGHAVAFNTARSFATTSKLMRELNIPSAVMCNGAHIVLNGSTVFLKYLDTVAVKEAARLAREANCSIYAADEKYLYTLNVEESNLAYLAGQCGGRSLLKPLGRMKAACKMDIFGDFPNDEAITARACVIMGNGSAGLLPPGVSKAQGLQALAQAAGFPLSETVAFGDSANDTGMLRAAGVGVAVGGAQEDVKAAADMVAGKIEDGGVYDALRQLGLI